MRAPVITREMYGDGFGFVTVPTWEDVRDHGAIGDGVIDDTAAIQAALDAAGYVNFDYSDLSPTLIGNGGNAVYLPVGLYRVTGTLYFYPGQLIFGDGIQSAICFEPADLLTNLFEPQAAVGLVDNLFRFNRFRDFQITSTIATFSNAAFAFTNITDFTIRNVNVKDFKYGLRMGGSSAKYYNRVEKCEFDHCELCVEADGASVTTFDSCKFIGKGGTWGVSADYEIRLLRGSGYLFDNCAFEGENLIAHVYDQSGGNAYVGSYTENAVFVLLDINEQRMNYVQVQIIGTHHGEASYPILKFENVTTLPGAANTYNTHGISFGQQYRFLPIISNSTGKRLLIDWTQSLGPVTQSPETFMSRYGWKLTADVDGKSILIKTGGNKTKIPRCAKITMTFLAKIETDGDFVQSSWVGASGGDLNRFRKWIDYGNGWFLYMASFTNDGSFEWVDLNIYLRNATEGNSAYVTNVRIYEGQGFDIFASDSENEPRIFSTAAPNTGTWEISEQVWKITPAASASPGWICIDSGTFSAATDNTGDTDGSTAVITDMTDTSDFFVGQYVTVSAGFPSAVIPYRILAKTATTITLDTNSNAVQANVTVATVDPVFKAMPNLAA